VCGRTNDQCRGSTWAYLADSLLISLKSIVPTSRRRTARDACAFTSMVMTARHAQDRGCPSSDYVICPRAEVSVRAPMPSRRIWRNRKAVSSNYPPTSERQRDEWQSNVHAQHHNRTCPMLTVTCLSLGAARRPIPWASCDAFTQHDSKP